MADYELFVRGFTVTANYRDTILLKTRDNTVIELNAEDANALGIALRSVAECSKHIVKGY